jgi:hypothetical protein
MVALSAVIAALAPSRWTRDFDSAEVDVEALFASRQSDVWLTVAGDVARVLTDDNDGSRHQRFVLRLESGHTLLIVHNIDLAPRVPGLAPGARVAVRGEYDWNDRGGVMHWTHHDPDGELAGGWVEYRDQRFR